MLRFTSLHQRLAVFMLLPVAILLFTMGFAGFIYARDRLLAQWGEAAILKLQRAAHHVDMRLKEPKELFNLFHESAALPHSMHIQGLILDQLRNMEGVVRLNLKWLNEGSTSSIFPDRRSQRKSGLPEPLDMRNFRIMPFHRGADLNITAPTYDAPASGETISLFSDLKDRNESVVGRLEVVLRFDALMDTIEATGWWQSEKAFLVDNEGNILAGNLPKDRKRLGDTDDPLEKATLYTMRSMPFGTVIGSGMPAREISGFYKLVEAPWTLVLVSPGKNILAPIASFQTYYLFIGGGFIVLILFLIRFVTGRTVAVIKSVSETAGRVATGDFSTRLPVRSADEVGELVQSFNTMVGQLEERAQLKDSINLAMEVQQNLLPKQDIFFEGLDIAGSSTYCDETGGDYYDFLQFPELGPKRMAVAVGDVAGHGIASALFMTTVRSLIRSRVVQSGSLAEIMNDVNRLLCLDTDLSGNFMTLFFTLFDVQAQRIGWVRAGHDPAMIYDPTDGSFAELGGKGIALGVDAGWRYDEYERTGWSYGQIIIIGTDGIWETENPDGIAFGKDRLRDIIKRNSYACAEKIRQAISAELEKFRNGTALHDDVTMVVIKIQPDNNHLRQTGKETS